MDSASTDPAVKKREIFGWAMFDVANSAYTTVVITIVFSAFFVNYLVPGDSKWANSFWGIAIAISTGLAMVLSPVLGTLCDLVGRKKQFLLINTLICALFTGLLYFVQPGQIGLAIGLIVISNTAWMLSEVFCASFLTDLADEKNMGMISGIGWGLGYIGGLLSLVIVLFGVVTADPATDSAAYIKQNQWAMVVVACYFVLVSLPTFLLLKERSKPQLAVSVSGLSAKYLFSESWTRLRSAFQLSRQLPALFQFFLVFTLYSAGMAIIIKFFGIYVDSELQMGASEKTTIFLALQISAFLGAVLFGFLEQKIGPKATIFTTLLWWSAGILAIYYLEPLAELLSMTTNSLFTVTALIAGAGLGSTQSASRAVVGMLSPKTHAAMLFGFWGLFGRIAVILGSLSFAVVSDMFSLQQGLLVILGFFVLGALLILLVPIDAGIKQASTSVQPSGASVAKSSAEYHML